MAKAQEYSTSRKVCKRIKMLMETHDPKVTQLELAKAIGCSRQTIGNYTFDTMPDAAHLESIADYFDISVDDLLGRPRKKCDDESMRLIEVSEYTGLSVEAIKALLIYPRLSDTISKICATKNGLLDDIGRYLFPRTGMIPDEEEAEIMVSDPETGIFHPVLGITDIDDMPPLLISNQGEFCLDRNAIDRLLIDQIVDDLKRMKQKGQQ